MVAEFDREALLEESGNISSEAIWRTTELRQLKPNWTSFRDAKLIEDRDAQFLIRFQREPLHTQGALLSEDSQEFCLAFLTILKNVNNEGSMQYLLTTLDELMKESKDVAKLFKHLVGTKMDPFAVLGDLMSKPDDLVAARACNVVVHLMNAGLVPREDSVRGMMDFVRTETQRDSKHKKFCFLAILAVLQALLRDHQRRIVFYEAKGLHMLIPLLKNHNGNTQLIYQVCHCIWLLSYTDEIKPKLADMQIAAILTHILKQVQKEKVVRMILGTFVNLIVEGEFVNVLSVCGAHRLLENMKQRTWNDEDINSDMETLLEKVSINVETKSNFDDYSKEILSGELEWTPMHRSIVFWDKNVHKFLERDMVVLKALLEYIKPGGQKESKTIAIALHDVGEFVRAHPSGKALVTKHGAKPYIMHHLTSHDQSVNKEALLCVQKLMCH